MLVSSSEAEEEEELGPIHSAQEELVYFKDTLHWVYLYDETTNDD